ncbi:MAG TPA: dihydroorotate dehydrogenase-like protein [Bacteroidales bacterium]|jgi:dihydroorotate dehydrogenase (fumarate)|nr:dihydroorotate dehydrogenase-like protein [Bacteroidales bacterium]
MVDLRTKYLGIELKNPVIIGASNLVTKLDNVKRAEQSGAAAIVYKSLFEEQIQLESAQLDDALDEYNDRNAESVKLFPTVEHAGPEEHLVSLRKVKENVKIPVIASLNAIYKESWVEYAKLIEQTGVDALELNFFYVPRDVDTDGRDITVQQLDVLKEVLANVKIPVSVKLSPFYANPLNIISRMDKMGVNGFVLFNRLFQPDIDIDKQAHFSPFNLSNPEDHKLSLRFAGLIYDTINGSICANTGIYTGADVVKMILAGADCVQVVSTVYKNKVEYVGTMLKDIESWMESKNYNTITDFRGRLSNKKINDPFVYKRAQYIDLLLRSDQIFRRYPVI